MDKTKLTYSAKYIPSVNVSVCKLSAYNYFQVLDKSSDTPALNCEDTVTRTVPLPANQSNKIFTVDLKDYYPNRIGNYVVTLSSPLIPNNKPLWSYPIRTYISVTNLIVTEKKIDPSVQDRYSATVLSGSQLRSLQNLYWVLDATTRQPIAGVTVSIYKNGQVVSSAITDKQGLASLTPVPGGETAIASFGSDSVVVSEGNSILTYAGNAENIKHLYIYTDKPLYKPGQEVDIKGIYRSGYDGFYDTPASQSLALKVYDSSNKVILEKQVNTNSYGSFNTSIELNTESSLGSYRVCVEYNCSNFDVLNYAPAAFRLTFADEPKEINFGDQPNIKLKADYYFGVPLSDASLNYRLSSQYYYFDKYTTEYFNFNNLYSDDMNSRYYYGDHYIGSGEGLLDDNGEINIKPDLKFKDEDAQTSKIIILDATVKDQQGRSIGGQKSFIMHAAPVYIGSTIDKSFAPTGAPLNLKVKTVDKDGKNVGMGNIKVQTYKIKWVNNGDPNSSGYYSSWTRQRDLVKTDTIRTDDNGNTSLQIASNGEGEYEVDVTSGQKGAAVGSRSWFYSYGNNSVSVRSTNDTYLDVIANKSTLKPGEMGEIVFEVPEGSAKALVTIERGKVFNYQVIDVVGSIAHYQFPVTPEYYPNIYVSVVAYPPGHEVRIGNENIIIDSDQKKLKLNITSDKKVYKPGDSVTLSLNATDDANRPVVSEVSVAVVDMSILALKGNPKKDPIREFYGHIPLTVFTYSNFKNLLKYVEPSDNGGKGGSGGDANAQKRRGVFKEVAYWKPDIITDQNGRASITFTLPDNLTTWQAEAVGVTKDTKVGAGYSEFTTNKTLMLNPLKPRFILPGDSFTIGATLFNRSTDNFDGKVSFKAASLILANKNADQNVSIKANESKNVYWDVRVPLDQKPGLVTYSIDASNGTLSDALDDTISVKTNTTYETVATAGQTKTSATESVYIPNSISKDQGQVTLRSSATLAVFLTNPLKYVLDYPYACTEQIATQIRSIALIKRAQAIPNVPDLKKTFTYNDKEYTLDEIINEELKTLYGRQNEDGGFSYWSSDIDSSFWATEQAVDAFRVLNDNGISVDNTSWKRAVDYLYKQYSTSKSIYRSG
jgi:uncharacterized protein YfaS (alpha-2-macroglobulin family)